MTPFDREILLGFLEEATGYLPLIREGLDHFRESPSAPDVLEETHRLVHTIKGASAMVGLPDLSHVAYHLEELIERIAHEPETATPELLRSVERGVEDIEWYLGHALDEEFRSSEWATAAKERLQSLAGDPVVFPAPSPSFFTGDTSDSGNFDASLEHLPLPAFPSPESATDPGDSFPPADRADDTVMDDLPAPSFEPAGDLEPPLASFQPGTDLDVPPSSFEPPAFEPPAFEPAGDLDLAVPEFPVSGDAEIPLPSFGSTSDPEFASEPVALPETLVAEVPDFAADADATPAPALSGGFPELRDLPAFGDLPIPDFDAPPAPQFAGETPEEDLLPDFAKVSAELPIPEFATESVPVLAQAPILADEPSGDLLDVFRAEAEDHLRALTKLLPEARKNPADRDRWREVRRAAHTLKGSAAMVGFENVTRLAHRMEDLLDAYYDGTRLATPREIDLLVAATDAIEDTVNGRANPSAFEAVHQGLEAVLVGGAEVPAAIAMPDLPEISAIPGDIASFPAAEEAPGEIAAEGTGAATAERGRARRELVDATVRVPIDRLNDIVKMFGELVIARTAFEQQMDTFGKLLTEAVQTAERLKRVASRIEAGYEARALASSGVGAGVAAGTGWCLPSSEGFDDLEFDRYTEFHLHTRELAETATDIGTVFGEFGRLAGDFDGHLTRQRRLSTEIEDKLMRLRMVPLAGIEAKLSRTVRQAASATGKAAELLLEGGRTGLDKTVLDAMADPLLHLLRNAVDHGFEPPEVRLALGKPASGTVRFTAAHEGSQVVLTIADDGRGIDFEQVRASAVRKGLLSESAAAGLSHDDLARVLFEPGFSTRTEVSQLSGRGVGLDVVKSRVEALQGTVGLASVPGRGSTFTIRLPMTLAVARSLLVQSAEQTFAIPLAAVEQLLRPDASDFDLVADNRVLRVGEEIFPVVSLAEVLGLPAAQTVEDLHQRVPVMILDAGGRRVALQVDRVLGGREIVIKSLGKYLRRIPCVSGGTLMGDGSVVLILNPAELVGRATGRSQFAESSRSSARDLPAAKAALTLLVVDDSPSVRRVLTGLGQRAGWEVHTAKDGLDALEILQRGAIRPTVVLSDVEMPRMDGYELLATIRGQASFNHLPVAMLTSRSGEKHRRKALDLGASAYVVKPYQDADLIEIIHQLARRGSGATVPQPAGGR